MLEYLKLKRQTIKSVRNDRKILKLSCTADKKNDKTTLQNNLEIFYIRKYTFTIWSSNSTYRYYPSGLRTYAQILYFSVLLLIIFFILLILLKIIQYGGETQVSTIWRISKQSVVNSFNGILLNNKNKQTTITCNNMDESQRHYSQTYKATHCMSPLVRHSGKGNATET